MIPFEPITALVGPNGVGKSAVLRAIDLVLGERWPSLASLRMPQDYTDFDVTKELRIQVTFASPLLTALDAAGNRAQIQHFRLTCKPYKNTGTWGEAGDPNFDFDALDAVEQKPMVVTRVRPKREYRPLLGVTGELRRQAPATLISHQRGLAQQMPWSRGSVLLKLLEPAKRELNDVIHGDDDKPTTRIEVFSRRYEAAMEVLRSPHVKQVEATIDEAARRTLGFLGRSRTSDVSIGFGIADPSNPLNSFRLVYREGAVEIPAEETGLGIQSAIVVGLFEALRRTRAQTGVVLIDEPEMYLHPQAQRYFHRLLTEMAADGQAQVIYSTHSPIFAEAYRFETLRLLRRPPAKYCKVSYVRQHDAVALERDRGKLLVGYDTSRSESLFADAVLLVEGPGDQLAAKEVARGVPLDLDAENLSVIACGGKTAIPYHARLCRALEIPVCAMYDDDLVSAPSADDQSEKAKKARDQNARASTETAEIEAALPSAADRFACSPSLETELGVGRGRDKPGRVLQAIRANPENPPGRSRERGHQTGRLGGLRPASLLSDSPLS